MRKTLLSASVFLLMSSSSAVMANDYRADNPSLYQAGWEQNVGEKDIRGSVYLRSKLKRLELENEDLRNSISQMRKGKTVRGDVQKDARIQALITENNRLLSVLRTQKTTKSPRQDKSADIYAQKLSEKNTEIQRLTSQLSRAKSDAEAAYEKELLAFRAENNRLKSSLNKKSKDTTDLLAKNENIKRLEGMVDSLEYKNSELQKSLKDSKRAHNTAGQDSSQEIAELQIEISALTQDNLKLKKEVKTSQDKVDASLAQENAALQTKVSSLTQENLKIKKEMSRQQGKVDASLAQENAELQTKVSSLTQENFKIKKEMSKQQGKVDASLAQENAELQIKVSSLTQENLKIKKEMNRQQGKVDASLAQENAELQTKVSSLTQKNSEIKKELNNVKSNVSASFNQDIIDLQKQNESLRKTIAAQNDVLRASDNASRVAEAMLSENAVLKNQLAQRKNSQSQNTESAKTLIELNNKLQDEIAKRDTYIQKLEPLKETIKALQDENNKLSFAKSQGGQSKMSASVLREKNKSLESALQKERAGTLEYRKKIKEYQENIASLEKQNSQATGLQLKNQDLKAQVNLLSKEEGAVSKSVVKYIETSYPKVDRIKPVLNNDGSRIESQGANDEGAIAPEDILSHSLKPLSDVK